MVSIIIPTLNSGKYLNDCLNSIFSNDYKDYEIVIVDGGSTDDTLSIIGDYKNEHQNIQLVKSDKRGVSFQRNLALKIAKGEYITFIDSDDTVSDNYLSTLCELIERGNYDVSFGGYVEFIDSDNNVPPHQNIIDVVDVKTLGIIEFYNDSYNNGYLISCSKLFKKDIIDDLYFDERVGYGEDTDFMFEVFKRSPKIIRTSETLYYYRFHETNAIKIANDNMLTNFIVHKKHLQYILDNSFANVLPLTIDRLYWSFNDIYLKFYKSHVKFPKSLFEELKKIILQNRRILYRRKISKYCFLFFPNFYSLIH